MLFGNWFSYCSGHYPCPTEFRANQNQLFFTSIHYHTFMSTAFVRMVHRINLFHLLKLGMLWEWCTCKNNGLFSLSNRLSINVTQVTITNNVVGIYKTLSSPQLI